jgi:hypothetical protein
MLLLLDSPLLPSALPFLSIFRVSSHISHLDFPLALQCTSGAYVWTRVHEMHRLSNFSLAGFPGDVPQSNLIFPLFRFSGLCFFRIFFPTLSGVNTLHDLLRGAPSVKVGPIFRQSWKKKSKRKVRRSRWRNSRLDSASVCAPSRSTSFTFLSALGMGSRIKLKGSKMSNSTRLQLQPNGK